MADLVADHFATGVNVFAPAVVVTPAVAVAKDTAPGVDSSSDDDSVSYSLQSAIGCISW